MILTHGIRKAAKIDGRAATHYERAIYAELRKRANAKDNLTLFLAAGGPFDGQLLCLPKWCDSTMISRWGGSNGQWHGRYSQDNDDKLPRPYQVGRGRPVLYWQNKHVPLRCK